MSQKLIWTIGHSNRPIDVFLELLASQEIKLVADVRRFPGSRRHPQFSSPQFEKALESRGIGYRHFPDLGGRRKPRPDSVNVAWRHAAFRGYADHMDTAAFQETILILTGLALVTRTAVLCAEALWWQCHRALIADYLKSRGWEVLHIIGPSKVEPHPYTSAASLRAGELSYAGNQGRLELPDPR